MTKKMVCYVSCLAFCALLPHNQFRSMGPAEKESMNRGYSRSWGTILQAKDFDLFSRPEGWIIINLYHSTGTDTRRSHLKRSVRTQWSGFQHRYWAPTNRSYGLFWIRSFRGQKDDANEVPAIRRRTWIGKGAGYSNGKAGMVVCSLVGGGYSWGTREVGWMLRCRRRRRPNMHLTFCGPCRSRWWEPYGALASPQGSCCPYRRDFNATLEHWENVFEENTSRSRLWFSLMGLKHARRCEFDLWDLCHVCLHDMYMRLLNAHSAYSVPTYSSGSSAAGCYLALPEVRIPS